MAVDMFLEIDGIKGESGDKVYGPKNAIDVLAWSWGASQSGTHHTGTGGGAGKVSVQDLGVTKWADKSSPALMQHVCNGKHIKKAILTVRKAGENPLEYIKLTMEDVLVTNVSGGGSGGEDRLTEHIALNFAKFEYKYTVQKPDGSKGEDIPVKWNIVKNAES